MTRGLTGGTAVKKHAVATIILIGWGKQAQRGSHQDEERNEAGSPAMIGEMQIFSSIL